VPTEPTAGELNRYVAAEAFFGLVRSSLKAHSVNLPPAMNWKERITTNPKPCGGRPCIRGMRIRVVDVLDLLAAGLSREQILDELPDLEEEDIEAVLRYASRRVDHPVLAA
jgi:uncharacterized protein (DUF433 family)